VDENVDMSVAKKVAAQFGISYAGNIPLTTTMLFGSEVENMSTVLDLVEKNAGPGYILSPGCDIPYAVPVSNIGALTMAIHKPEEARVIVANQQSSSSEKVNVTLPNYNQLKRPLVEVITIDSDTCPPCKYMVEATRQVAKMIPGGIDWQEHKITTPENVARMRLLGVKNLPTIVINGKVAFISRIPDLDTYSQAILKKGDT
jgi:uroporphyrinogen decarboxylase